MTEEEQLERAREDFKRMVGKGQRQLHSARMMEHWAKQEALRTPQKKERE